MTIVESQGAACRQGYAAPGSDTGWRAHGGEGSFPNKASHIERRGEDISQEGDLGAVGQAKAVRAFHATAGLVGVAAFRIAAAAGAQLPGGGADGMVTGQTDVAVGEREAETHQLVGVLTGAICGR